MSIQELNFVPNIMTEEESTDLKGQRMFSRTSPVLVTEKLNDLKEIFKMLQTFESLITPKNSTEVLYTRKGDSGVQVTVLDNHIQKLESKMHEFQTYIDGKGMSMKVGGKTATLGKLFQKLQVIFDELHKHYINGGKQIPEDYIIADEDLNKYVSGEKESFRLGGRKTKRRHQTKFKKSKRRLCNTKKSRRRRRQRRM
jgi:hypothetical protein